LKKSIIIYRKKEQYNILRTGLKVLMMDISEADAAAFKLNVGKIKP
jgi:hypothetical protein